MLCAEHITAAPNPQCMSVTLLKLQVTNLCLAWYSIYKVFPEAEAWGELEPRSSRPAWAIKHGK